MTKKLLTGIVLFVIYTLPGKAQVNATASEGLKKLDEASTKVGAMAWKGSVEVAAWTFSQRSTDPAKGGDNRAAELVAAGETDAQGDAAMLEMPLKLVQGRTKFLYCSTDGKSRRITPVRNGVFGLTEDGFHYTLYSITGMRLSKENEWKVSTMNRVPVMEFPGLLLQKAESQGNNLGDPQLWFISVDGPWWQRESMGWRVSGVSLTQNSNCGFRTSKLNHSTLMVATSPWPLNARNGGLFMWRRMNLVAHGGSCATMAHLPFHPAIAGSVLILGDWRW